MSRSMGARRRNSVKTSKYIRYSAKVVSQVTGKIKNESRIMPHGTMTFVSAPFVKQLVPNPLAAGDFLEETVVQKPGNTAIKIGTKEHGITYITLEAWKKHVAKSKAQQEEDNANG